LDKGEQPQKAGIKRREEPSLATFILSPQSKIMVKWNSGLPGWFQLNWGQISIYKGFHLRINVSSFNSQLTVNFPDLYSITSVFLKKRCIKQRANLVEILIGMTKPLKENKIINGEVFK
jgi:hypothetical protein